MTLIGWICKSYNTFNLFNIYCLSFFFSSHQFVFFFFTALLHCLFTFPFWLATLSFFFFKFWTLATVSSGTVAIIDLFFFFFSLLFVLFFPFYIYITVHPVFLLCHFVEPLCLFFFLVINRSYSTKLSQNLLFHIQFFLVAFLFIFFLYTLF